MEGRQLLRSMLGWIIAGGQNKNNHGIRVANLIVELGVALACRIIFLVRGHTKNDCDRMHNLLKAAHRTSNVFAPKQLLEFIATSNKLIELVDVERVVVSTTGTIFR